MVCKIMPATVKIANTIHYNRKKIDSEMATLVSMFNIEQGCSIEDAFSIYERANIRTEKPVFHLSINPSHKEIYTDESILNSATL